MLNLHLLECTVKGYDHISDLLLAKYWVITGCKYRQCYSLSKVTCKASTPPNIGSCAFESIAEFPTLLVPAGCVDAYSESDWGNHYFSTIKEME